MSTQLVNLLREEFKNLHLHVQELSIAIARLEEKHEHSVLMISEAKDMRHEISRLSDRLIKVSGINGNNGKLSEIAEAQEKNTKKIESLILSRAVLVGYAVAAGGTAGILAKFLI